MPPHIRILCYKPGSLARAEVRWIPTFLPVIFITLYSIQYPPSPVKHFFQVILSAFFKYFSIPDQIISQRQPHPAA